MGVVILICKFFEFFNLDGMNTTFRDIKVRVDKFLEDNSMKYVDVIIDERLSNTLYGNNSRVGQAINLFKLRDLLEPNMKRDRSRL